MFNLQPIIDSCHAVHPIWIAACMFVVSVIAVLAAKRLFGLTGLYVYSALAVIVANIQVLKVTQFGQHSVALGTLIFASVFLCSDIITEYYSKQAAYLSIQIGFVFSLIFSVFMLLTLAYRPAPQSLEVHTALEQIFIPTPTLLVASLLVYVISQYTDVYVYALIKRLTYNRWLWFRAFLSKCCSVLIDNTLFSLLAWHILATKPLPLKYIFGTYIFSGFVLRVCISILYIPILYLLRK